LAIQDKTPETSQGRRSSLDGFPAFDKIHYGSSSDNSFNQYFIAQNDLPDANLLFLIEIKTHHISTF